MAIKDGSLLNRAVELFKKQRKHEALSIDSILKELLKNKKYSDEEYVEIVSQFYLDFMMSGYFIFCGDSLWDLKERQPVNMLDKDGGDFDDIFADDEDVLKNELRDGATYATFTSIDEDDADEDDTEEEETDDIALELGLSDDDTDEEETDEIREVVLELDEDEVEEDADDIEEELSKR
jgi:DNA-directed RNA polymerase subunit delta